jgi:predicted aspartyl protease
VEVVSNGTVLASEEVEIQDKETELEIVVTNQAEIPILGVNVNSALSLVVSLLFVLVIVGLTVLYRIRNRQFL